MFYIEGIRGGVSPLVTGAGLSRDSIGDYCTVDTVRVRGSGGDVA